MQPIRILISALLIAITPMSAGAMQCGRGPAPEEKVKRMLISGVEAWNQGNLEKFMRGYWRSPDLTFFSEGDIRKGWERTLLRYRQRYQGEARKMGQLELRGLKIDLLSCRAAAVTGQWELSFEDGRKPHGLFTLVVKRMNRGWRIVHDHTSEAGA